jgi:hypothetical protein
VSGGTFPRGLTLASGTGLITGVPQGIGAFGFTYSVTDSVGNTVSLPARIDVSGSGCLMPILNLLLDDG